MDFDQITFENSFTNVTFCHCCVWENWDWMWEIVVLDYFDVGDSTAGFFAVGDFGTGLFCCGRFYCWTFLLWEILMLDFLASGQMNCTAPYLLPGNALGIWFCGFRFSQRRRGPIVQRATTGTYAFYLSYRGISCTLYSRIDVHTRLFPAKFVS